MPKIIDSESSLSIYWHGHEYTIVIYRLLITHDKSRKLFTPYANHYCVEYSLNA